jgi:hypothetical protein
MGCGDADGGEGAGQAREVSLLVDEPAVPHLADLVDAVAELEGTVLDMDGGVAVPAGSGHSRRRCGTCGFRSASRRG